MANFVWAASMDLATAEAIVFGPEVIEPSALELLEPTVEATLTFQQTPVPEVSAVNKTEGVFIPV